MPTCWSDGACGWGTIRSSFAGQRARSRRGFLHVQWPQDIRAHGHWDLYGKEALLDAMPPYRGGGEMIGTVSFEKGTTYNELPTSLKLAPRTHGGCLGGGLGLMNGGACLP